MIVYAIDPTVGTSEEQFRVPLGTSASLKRAKLSPDGSWLAYMVEDQFRSHAIHLIQIQAQQVYTVLSDGFEPPFTSFISTEKQAVFDWSPDSQRLLIHIYEFNNASTPEQFYIYDTTAFTLTNMQLELSFIDKVQWVE